MAWSQHAPQQITGRLRRAVVGILLALHVALLAWVGTRISPAGAELGHLPAGIYVWQFGRFDLYHVNPPLVRAVAAAPVAAFADPITDWQMARESPGVRPEWIVGQNFIRANGWEKAFRCFVLGRWACIPFSVLGACVCYRWARALYGDVSGVLALSLWCFCPNVLGWGSTICPDVPAAAMGVAGAYTFWRWLGNPRWTQALIAGVTLGLAELTKMTWVILFALWPIVWLTWLWASRRQLTRHACFRQMLQLLAMLLLAAYVLNAGYGFQGSLKRLGAYTFVSRTLAGAEAIVEGGQGGNRFSTGWLGKMPVPFPEDFVAGIDLQKLDFEVKRWSYLCGEWKYGGWWYYYLVCALLKVPAGTWVLGGVTLWASALRCTRAQRDASVHGPPAETTAYCAGWRNELVLLLPAVGIIAFISSQTGFSHHFRYMLPAFPFIYVGISKVGRSIPLNHRKVAILGSAALVWSVGSSLWIYPHSMSYFNEFAGGPTRGHQYLVDSNIDWGQDMLYLKRWLGKHPEIHPLSMTSQGFLTPQLLGIDAKPAPQGPEIGLAYRRPDGGVDRSGPRPGWYAMSVHRIRCSTESYQYFLRFRPVGMVGYSIYLYHVTPAEANRVRTELGIPKLEESSLHL